MNEMNAGKSPAESSRPLTKCVMISIVYKKAQLSWMGYENHGAAELLAF
jgi:hypothetical protein